MPKHPGWRTSSFTHSDNCVEIKQTGDVVLVRNSNHPNAGTIAFGPEAMAAWIEGIKAGEFDDLA